MTAPLRTFPKLTIQYKPAEQKANFNLVCNYTSQQQELSHAKRVHHPYPQPWEEPTLTIHISHLMHRGAVHLLEASTVNNMFMSSNGSGELS